MSPGWQVCGQRHWADMQYSAVEYTKDKAALLVVLAAALHLETASQRQKYFINHKNKLEVFQ